MKKRDNYNSKELSKFEQVIETVKHVQFDFLTIEDLIKLAVVARKTNELVKNQYRKISSTEIKNRTELLKILDKEGSTLLRLNLFRNQHVDDKVLEKIAEKCPKLQIIYLEGCRNITNDGLAKLKPLSNLHTVNIKFCNQITDKGIYNLSLLQKLNYLNVSFCKQITKLGFFHLVKTSLRNLNIAFCNQTSDEELNKISQIKELHTLNIEGCQQVTDVGIEYLKKLSLCKLNISKSKNISDSKLTELLKTEIIIAQEKSSEEIKEQKDLNLFETSESSKNLPTGIMKPNDSVKLLKSATDKSR